MSLNLAFLSSILLTTRLDRREISDYRPFSSRLAVLFIVVKQAEDWVLVVYVLGGTVKNLYHCLVSFGSLTELSFGVRVC